MLSFSLSHRARFVLAIILVCFVGIYFLSDFPGAVKPGFSKHWFYDSSGERHPYVLFLPYAESSEIKRPVILFLNGGGENGNDGVAQVSNNFGLPVWELRGKFPFICVAPQMTKESRWTDPDSPRGKAAIEILKFVVDRYGGDPDRVYVTGPSSGGNGTFAFAQLHGDLFAAIAPVASGYGSRPERLASMPIWSLFNKEDSEVVNGARAMKAWLLEQGASPHSTEYLQAGHDSWSHAYRDPALYHWMLRNVRSTESSEKSSNYQLLSIPELAELIEAEDLMVEGDSISNRCVESRALVLPLLGDALHFEYRSEGLVPCELVFDRATKAQVKIFIPPPELGSAYIKVGPTIYDCRSVPHCSYKRSNWNDIRVTIDDDMCSVELNGWALMEAPLAKADSMQAQFTILLEGSNDLRHQEFRFIRMAQQRKHVDEK